MWILVILTIDLLRILRYPLIEQSFYMEDNMDREEMKRWIRWYAANLPPEDFAECVEKIKKTAPVSHTEAVKQNPTHTIRR